MLHNGVFEHKLTTAKEQLSQLPTLFSKVGAFFNRNKTVKSSLRYAVLLGIVSYLIFKLSAIGWTNILQSLPSSPLFYLLSVVFVCLPILTEKIVFNLVTNSTTKPSLKVFARKHVINKAVMNYAGEGYFINELSKLDKFTLQSAAIVVKNLTLIRTFAANFWVILLVVLAMALGNFDVLTQIMSTSPTLVIAVGIITLGACLAGLVFFRKLTRLKLSLSGKVAAIYMLRSAIAAAVLIVQWSLILPGTALAVWCLFLMVFFIAKKSPVGGDLVFVSVALTLPGFEGDSAAVAAMLLTMAAVFQMLYSLGFVITSEWSLPKYKRATLQTQ